MSEENLGGPEQEVVPEQMQEQEQTMSESHLEEWPDDRFKELQEGQIIEAKIILVHDDAAFVDIGGKSDLTIPLAELTTEPVTSAKSVVNVGDVIKVIVLKSGEDEKILLSKRLVDQEQSWFELEEAFAKNSTMTGTVTQAVKGGLQVKIGTVQAFMPASQVALSFVSNLEEFVGQTFSVKILEFDRAKRRVVASRRVILEVERKEAEVEIYNKLKEGERKEGKVTRLADFGAFVDLGSGVEGLIHVSELSWNRVKSPREVLNEGDIVEVLITKVDPASKRISLSLKQIQNHPWDELIGSFQEEKVYPGTVVRLESFGAFVRLAPGIDGLAHISQISDKRISKPDEVLKIDDQVQAKILKIDRGARKISLSLSAVSQDEEQQVVNEFIGNQNQEAFTQSLAAFFKKGK